MSGYSWAPLAWIFLLVVSWPYLQRTPCGDGARGGISLIFVTTFSALAAVLFGMMTTLLAGFGEPVGARDVPLYTDARH